MNAAWSNTIIQTYETMLNYKYKSHCGRSPLNRTDSICIVECDSYSVKIQNVWAELISNKKTSTIIQIICKNMAAMQ